jgi:uncharacterized protein (TIGR02246 family)
VKKQMHDDQSPDPRRAAEEAKIRALYKGVLEGWNQGRGEVFAAPFSADATFVAFDGSVLSGREQIAETHQELFDKWLGGTRLFDEWTRVRFLGPDAAVVISVGGTVMRGRSKPALERDSIQTLVAVRDADAWSFVSFQNTRIRPIGANAVSALLWLVTDKLWGLFFRASRVIPRTTVRL